VASLYTIGHLPGRQVSNKRRERRRIKGDRVYAKILGELVGNGFVLLLLTGVARVPEDEAAFPAARLGQQLGGPGWGLYEQYLQIPVGAPAFAGGRMEVAGVSRSPNRALLMAGRSMASEMASLISGFLQYEL
jgi:hypothetical protein